MTVTLNQQVDQLEQRLDQHMKAVSEFKSQNPNCMAHGIQVSNPKELTNVSHFFAEKMANFASEAGAITAECQSLLERMTDLEEVTPEIAQKCQGIATKSLTFALEMNIL